MSPAYGFSLGRLPKPNDVSLFSLRCYGRSLWLKLVPDSDGQTWSTPQQVEAGPGWSLAGPASGPAGVLEYASASGQATNISARVWHGGSWSTAAALTSSTVGLLWQCAAAVGNSDALVVCNSSTKLDAQHFAGGAWTDLPIGSAASVNTPVFVGSDIRPRPYSI
jgi:hypothetical protein